ncbi:DNA-polymerase I [Sesbania bispinosa]|nr:DNA-polymerase I [Sesbania bispinosa]
MEYEFDHGWVSVGTNCENDYTSSVQARGSLSKGIGHRKSRIQISEQFANRSRGKEYGYVKKVVQSWKEKTKRCEVVDTVARWSDNDDLLERMRGKGQTFAAGHNEGMLKTFFLDEGCWRHSDELKTKAIGGGRRASEQHNGD